MWVHLGPLWLLVMNQYACIVSGYRNSFLQINLHINYILHYYYNLKTMLYLLKFFCLAHHLMCWPETSGNSFKPLEKIFHGSFQA